MKTTTLFALFAWWVAWGSMASPGWAQSALERLERQIRQQTAAPKGTPPDAAKPPPPPQPESPHARGDVEPGYLGVAVDDQKDRGRGVRVIEVHRGSPAEKAGLRRQDIITSLAGVRVRQMTDLSDVLGTLAAGQSVDFEVLREEKPQKVRVTLGQRPAAERSVRAARNRAAASRRGAPRAAATADGWHSGSPSRSAPTTALPQGGSGR